MTRLAALCVFGCLAACGRGDRVARVGDTTLSKADISASSARVGDAQALDTAVEVALLAEGAKKSGLADDNAVRARADDAYRQVLGDALVNKVMSDATTEEKLRARFERDKVGLKHRRVHVAQIFLKAGPTASPKMSMVLARLRAGEKFEALAKELSEDPPTAPRGGELRPIDEGTTDSGLFEAAAKLKKGETSDVLTSAYGLRVLLALDDVTTIEPSFEDAKGALAASAMKDAKHDLLEELKKTIPVKIEEGQKR